MKNNLGSTLVELTFVIIILGVITINVIPRFINLQNDARSATLQAMKGVLKMRLSNIFNMSSNAISYIYINP